MIKAAWIVCPVQDTSCLRCKKKFKPSKDSSTCCSFECAKKVLSESDRFYKQERAKKISFRAAMRKYNLSHYGDSLPNV